MRFMKYAGVWLVSILVILLTVNFGLGLFVNLFLGNAYMPALYGYSKKWDFPISDPITEEQEKHNGATLMLRTIFNNQTIYSLPEDEKKFPFFKITVDQSTVLLNSEGRHAFSSGCYALVYHDFGEKSDYVRNAFGLADLRELCKKEGADALCDALKAEPNAVIRLDAYTLDAGKVTPVRITLLDANGNEIFVSDFPAEGSVIRENNCYIKNKADNINDTYNVYIQLRHASEGELSADRIAEKYAEKVTPGAPDYSEDHLQLGVTSMTRILVEAINGNTSIHAVQIHYPMAVIIYSCALILLLTMILTVLFIKRR